MDDDQSHGQSLKQKAQDLQSLTNGSLSSSISKLSGSSRAIPSDRDFHFYYNFDEFKKPMKEIAAKSKSMLETIGSSSHVWGKPTAFPEDLDDAYDWLVNVNDEVFERFDSSVDEFQRVRKMEEETGRPAASAVAAGDSDNGFQLVCGKKKKGMIQSTSHLVAAERNEGRNSTLTAVKVASRDNKAMGAKPRVPFHIPTIPRPQKEYNILVNNNNQPFEHVWLQKSEDGSRFVHPLEKLSVLDFVDRTIGDLEPVKPSAIECSTFKLVEEVKDLKDLAAKLRSVNEFAVDLEHNSYRSFQGLTCLMQISTRTEDFVVDTLKLRIHIGPYLREVFKDPTKKKVMHGADRDIVWLQRDFGIYICNMFDTGQASRVLKLERNSLEYLLHHFCGVTANKEYQNADWRLRPLPDEMLRYAREDTHYLLYIYDLLKIRLLTPSESENSDALLVEVYKRSYDTCMQLYEKELLTDSSYLYIYGMQGVEFNAEQLAIVAGLCEWRDVVARAEDESTGYILPNKTLLEIAKQMPVTASKLRRLLRSKHPYIEQNMGSVVSIIRHSIQNAAAFEAVAEQLKEGRLELATQEAVEAEGSESLTPSQALTSMKDVDVTAGSIYGDDSENGTMVVHLGASVCAKKEPSKTGSTSTELYRDKQRCSSEHLGENGAVENEIDHFIPGIQGETLSISGKIVDTKDTSVAQSAKVIGATVQVLKKPSRAFGALLGSSASKRKFDMVKNDKEAIKLEQIKSSVNLPFHSFAGEGQLKLVAEKHTEASRVIIHPEDPPTVPATSSNLEDVILLEGDSIDEESINVDSEAQIEQTEYREGNSARAASEINDGDGDGDEPMSLSELSSSFQKCFQPGHQTSKGRQVQKSQESVEFSQLKPFDYEAAKIEVSFGGKREKQSGVASKDKRNSSGGKKSGRAKKDDESGDFQQGRRRQAFPATGNRSATFRGV